MREMFTDVLSVVAALSIMLRCSISMGMMMHCHYASALSSHPSASSAAMIQSVGQSSRLNNAFIIRSSSRRTASARPFCRSSSLLVCVHNNDDDASDIINSQHEDDSSMHDHHHEHQLSATRALIQPHFPFPLDTWQLHAASSILSRHNVIVCAPTGSGKTVVGEIALRIALTNNTKGIYTTPLKALSNQKFGEMQRVFGVDKVGLATGDVCIRRGAEVTVMTTEVYRNMAWKARDGGETFDDAERSKEENNNNNLSFNSIVVLDEFHYMGEKGRGSTWEESVIFNPPNTQIVSLSATLPNAHRLASWMTSVTGRQTDLIQANGARPVPLRYYFATKRDFAPLFKDEDAGPGAPNGLLGLRGDGVVMNNSMSLNNKNNNNKSTKKKKTLGNSKAAALDDAQISGLSQLPIGLHLNPILQQSAERQMASIDRRIQRIIQQQQQQYGSYNDKYNTGSSAISAREQRKMKENMLKAELRKSVPSISTLIQYLRDHDLLPGIFFIFSRKGCDTAAEVLCDSFKSKEEEESSNNRGDNNRRKRRKNKLLLKGRGRRSENREWDLNQDDELLAMVQDDDGRNLRADLLDQLLSDEFDAAFEDDSSITGDEEANDDSFLSEKNLRQYSEIGLLNYDDVKKVAYRVLAFNEGNPEIAFPEGVVEQLLCGIGSHHAGMLPAHKAFVETLFRLELMKAIFATETLAAGINMPARTTVICSMAKRGDLGMNLLETSNMLQMAGRAGRRGMDTAGSCVIAATPFEGPGEAITILTNEIKPIVSQFTPSYALAVNLIDRGNGRLDLARSMVEKSFGAWESRQRELDLQEAMMSLDSQDGDSIPEEQFLNALQLTLEKELLEVKDGTSRTGTSQSKISKLTSLVDVLSNGKKLKKVSKQYSGAASILELEQSTLSYLELEYRALEKENDPNLPSELMDVDREELVNEIKTQRQRVMKGQREVNNSLLSMIAKVANNRMRDDTDGTLRKALATTRLSHEESPTTFIEGAPLEPGELNAYIKVAPKNNRKPILDQTTASSSDESEDETWGQMEALLKVLQAYGCLTQSTSVKDEVQYSVTPGGKHVGSLGMDNSLWVLSALGGAWDVAYESAELDKFQDHDDPLDDYDIEEIEERSADEKHGSMPKPQIEADTLIRELCGLDAGEMAGYVSSLVVDAPRHAGSAVESFTKLTSKQQHVVQAALVSLERLVEVQRRFGLDDSIGKCQLELTSIDVFTAWASGESWSECLTMSGLAPGDLVRILSRALDALRQIANLPYIPARGLDGTLQVESVGVHPTIRSLCKKAVVEMDRYPVKDDFPFQQNESDESEEDQDSGTTSEVEDEEDIEIAVDG
eukprot:scaffold12069_cov45-Cyclotella_meneghiniana.AAC.2